MTREQYLLSITFASSSCPSPPLDSLGSIRSLSASLRLLASWPYDAVVADQGWDPMDEV